MSWRHSLALGAVVLGSYMYFYQAGGFNQNSRYDLVRAITEKRSLRIDEYASNTGDKAVFHGHFYSDKAPGTAFVAVPAVAALRPVLRLAGIDPNDSRGGMWLSYTATLVGAMIPATIAAICLFWLTQRMGGTPTSAMFAALVFALGTPMFAYATIFFGHALAAASLMVSFTAAVAVRHAGTARRDACLGAAVGLVGGWAIVTDFTAAVPVVLVAGLALVNARARPGTVRRIALAGSLGGIATLAVLGLYQFLAFGSPFHLGYSNDTIGPAEGFFGIARPSLHVLGSLMLGRYRGLLPLAPVLALAPVGIVLLSRTEQARNALVASAIVVYYILLNSGFKYWWGGNVFGPRHLAPALPFLCLGLGPMWDAARRVLKLPVLMAAGYGFAVCLAGVATNPQINQLIHDPVWTTVWPMFWHGRLSVYCFDFMRGGLPVFTACVPSRSSAWNLGQEAFGLHGLPSLVPLCLLWVLGAVALTLLTPTRSAAAGLAGMSPRSDVVEPDSAASPAVSETPG